MRPNVASYEVARKKFERWGARGVGGCVELFARTLKRVLIVARQPERLVEVVLPGTVTLTGGQPKRSDFAERRCQTIALVLVISRQPAKAVSRAARRSTAVVDWG